MALKPDFFAAKGEVGEVKTVSKNYRCSFLTHLNVGFVGWVTISDQTGYKKSKTFQSQLSIN